MTEFFNVVRTNSGVTKLIEVPTNAIVGLAEYKATVKAIPNGELVTKGLSDFRDIIVIGTIT